MTAMAARTVPHDLAVALAFVRDLGKHDGACDADGPGPGTCAQHMKAFSQRRAAALSALARMELHVQYPEDDE